MVDREIMLFDKYDFLWANLDVTMMILAIIMDILHNKKPYR